MSNIKPTDEALEAYQKLSRSKCQYVIFHITKKNGMEVIDVDKVGEKNSDQDASWDEFCDNLPEDSGRYGVFDIRWTMDDGRLRDSVCFVGWTPDNCKIRQKMLYGATLESFKGQLEGIKSTIVAHDQSDLSDGREEVLKK
eukprot:g3538.t1